MNTECEDPNRVNLYTLARAKTKPDLSQKEIRKLQSKELVLASEIDFLDKLISNSDDFYFKKYQYDFDPYIFLTELTVCIQVGRDMFEPILYQSANVGDINLLETALKLRWRKNERNL